MVPSATCGFIWSHSFAINWWGMTKTRILAPFTACVMSGTATWCQQRNYVTYPYLTADISQGNTPQREAYRLKSYLYLISVIDCATCHSPITYHVSGQLVAGQVLDILVLGVDNLWQLPALDQFFVHPHVHHRIETVGGFDIVPNDFGNGWAPGTTRGIKKWGKVEEDPWAVIQKQICAKNLFLAKAPKTYENNVHFWSSSYPVNAFAGFNISISLSLIKIVPKFSIMFAGICCFFFVFVCFDTQQLKRFACFINPSCSYLLHFKIRFKWRNAFYKGF